MSDYKDHLYALILAGGGGTRLWPKSLNKTPKQFLKLFNNKTLTQITCKRFRKILPWERIFVVTVSDKYKKEIIKEVPYIHPDNIIVEPARKDTGPAHGIGAAYIYKNDSDAVIITESADRLVKPVSRYLKVLKSAARVAYKEKKLIAVGVKPRYPHTGYGYVQRGEKIETKLGVKLFKLKKFVEKPELSIAKRYVSRGGYYWNAGQFVWRADVLLKSLKIHEPAVGKPIEKILNSIGSSQEKGVVSAVYKKMPKISIDCSVAEKDKNFLLIVADFFWTDIGDWKEVWENLDRDEMGNVIIDGKEPGGRVINIDTSDALIHTNGRLIAIIDVDNVVVVDTKEALLVCSKSKAQNVKKIVNQLRNEGKKELL